MTPFPTPFQETYTLQGSKSFLFLFRHMYFLLLFPKSSLSISVEFYSPFLILPIFNYNNITAKLDGKELTDTFLINDPEGYQSIKTNLPDEYITQGYLVWEVPETWKKLEVTYSGWTQSYYTEPTIILTPDVLKTPETYNSDNSII